MSVRELLRANDRRFLEQACDLSVREWAAPSLRDQWSNHELLAHLVGGYGGGLGELVGEMCCRHGSFDAANTALAQRLAATRTPAHLFDELAVLVATDVGWTHGRSGPRVAGRAADMVSVLASRPRRLDALTGEGVAVLAERLRRARSPTRTGA
jgi:hypothetical protein